MSHTRGYRGWMAAVSVGVTLTLIFLCVGKYIQIPTKRFFKSHQTVSSRAASTSVGEALPVKDPGKATVDTYPGELNTPLVRRSKVQTPSEAVGLLRRPPQPAAAVALSSPQPASDGLVDLPLNNSDSDIYFLMQSMDSAFDSPIRTTSNSAPRKSTQQADSAPEQNFRSMQGLPNSVITSLVPEPRKLLQQIDALEECCTSGAMLTSTSHPAPVGSASLNRAEQANILSWIDVVRAQLHQLVHVNGLEHPNSLGNAQQLAQLAEQAVTLGESLESYSHAKQMLAVAYALQRRVDVWLAIQACLDPTSIALTRVSSTDIARDALQRSLAAVEARLSETGNEEHWQQYLLIDQLNTWVKSDKKIWAEGNDLALNALSRLRWERLSDVQREFLSQEEFQQLAAHLEAWSRDPVDYRQMLIDLEQLEFAPLDRNLSSLAGAVQVLRTSPEPAQQKLAAALNNHYRNANIRLCVSRELLESFLPESEIEVRPIRRRILGADTAGDSTVHTKLHLQFNPSEDSWDVGVGVTGDVYANTASSKGPATFHNTSMAQISSLRYLRMNPMGYSISSEPTNVQSREYLRKMSTDFDGLPVVGDFVRLIVREQFDQKRSLAQRISRRIMADEADTEFDRRLNEGLSKAEEELQQRITGPLHRLKLDPMVVSMGTTEQRLDIRYRVAGRHQMASHNPRPRAPSDSLLSMQVHQSTINNTIANLNLGGKTWTLAELAEKMGQVLGQTNWQLGDDVPGDATIRFAESRPAYVDIENGLLRLTLRIQQFQRGDKPAIGRLIVTSSYMPVADGLSAELIRSGSVEIKFARNTPLAQRLLARTIFAKVFVSRPRIALISEKWQADERAQGLAVSQLELRDSWLSVAISKAGSAHAIEVADRSRFIKQNY
ncbi:MAG: hypothetical protein Aurels2KO_06020 [Aureliella sp.]